MSPSKKAYWYLTLLSLLLFLPGLKQLPVMDRDEAHFAQATRQMLQTGEYFQVRFQEKTRFQKPPGINWLQAASVALFSDQNSASIWPYRLPTALCAWLSLLLTFCYAKRFIPEKAAFRGALFLGISLLLQIEAHIAVIDAALLFAVICMQGALWHIYASHDHPKRWALIFWLAMTAGFVLKGVTPLVGLLTIMTLCISDRRINWLKTLYILPGLLFFILCNLTWLWFVSQAEHSNYLLQMIHRDLMPKLIGGHESHGHLPFFHLLTLPLFFWPASLFLWQGGVYAKKYYKTPTVRFLLAWLIPTWIFFEMMPTKLPQYILPTYPAIALLCALGISESIASMKTSRILHLLQVGWFLLSIGLFITIAALPYVLLHTVPLTSIFLASVTILLSAITLYFAWHREYQIASKTLVMFAICTYPLVFSCLLPTLTPLWISKNIAQFPEAPLFSDEHPLLAIDFDEPSLVFNLNSKHVIFTTLDDALLSLSMHPQRYLLISRPLFETIPEHATKFIVLRETNGYNYSKGRQIDLVLVRSSP